MKKAVVVLLLIIMTVSVCACKRQDTLPELKGDITGLSTKLENSFELQKSIFEAKIISVSQTDMLVPKYNFDITNYTVYTVEITESFDGITPLGSAKIVSAGSSEEFLARLSLKKGETYILTAEPWVYGNEIIYLLSIFQNEYPKLDSAGRIVMKNEDGKMVDYGSKADYIQSFADAKADYEQKNPEFFDPKNALSRYKQIFGTVLETNSKSWLRDGFVYDFIPSDEFIKETVTSTKSVCDFIQTLEQKQDVSNADLTALLSSLNVSLY